MPVVGKIGTTSDFRDPLFGGSTYGPHGIMVAVRVGSDDNCALGEKEIGGRTAPPIFREIMLRVYERQFVGPVPSFPREIEAGIDQYRRAARDLQPLPFWRRAVPVDSGRARRQEHKATVRRLLPKRPVVS